MKTEKKILIFGCQDPKVILQAAAEGKAWGAEVQSVPREGWHCPIGEIAAGRAVFQEGAAPAAAGQMLVLCGLEGELSALLPALRRAGAGGPAAVLTATNRSWTAQRLYLELEREAAVMRDGPRK